MPGGDKTGPLGNGSMTGKRLGDCTGNEPSKYEPSSGNFGYGFARRWGMRMGRRFRYGYKHLTIETQSNVSEEKLLENEVKILKEHLASIEKQLAELKKKSE